MSSKQASSNEKEIAQDGKKIVPAKNVPVKPKTTTSKPSTSLVLQDQNRVRKTEPKQPNNEKVPEKTIHVTKVETENEVLECAQNGRTLHSPLSLALSSAKSSSLPKSPALSSHEEEDQEESEYTDSKVDETDESISESTETVNLNKIETPEGNGKRTPGNGRKVVVKAVATPDSAVELPLSPEDEEGVLDETSIRLRSKFCDAYEDGYRASFNGKKIPEIGAVEPIADEEIGLELNEENVERHERKIPEIGAVEPIADEEIGLELNEENVERLKRQSCLRIIGIRRFGFYAMTAMIPLKYSST
ncbi:hypothetical protein RHSIM_Rhsim09G0190800 [Rhododendron simsii]|uniref:Uncharacterized protein n=1 Tax=Rhododendron simsii TaxID=118357 RepID=A0A834GH89_RHOSS|nr:hypothetical protein RHSIM_Rhsim09G0190800 [Rhododendron simsii]